MEERERERAEKAVAIKYVCMDAFTESQARGNRAELRRMRDEDAGGMARLS